MRLGIIINPAAGRRSALRVRHLVERFCAREDLRAEFVVLKPSERIESVAQRLAPEVDVLGIVGGDGTLNGVVNGLLTSPCPETPLAFVPAGRGKDIARTLRSWHPRELHRCSTAHRLRQVDVGLIESGGRQRYFLNETSIGTGALAARSAAGLPRMMGTSAYLTGTAGALVRGRPFAGELVIDGMNPVNLHRCHHITIANGRYFGGGLQIAPPADPEDGLLEIVAVADVSALTIARALPRLFLATHLAHPAVRHWQTGSLRVETTQPVLVESDGETWTSTPLTVTVLKQALTWVEPA
ncbi:MAG TPA: diacylglycerol kinase family protein [Thermomicrobiales bacterium]|nr:diacylglycerol kinase family protein [Thermomicrobiales bacterium]